MLNILMLLNLLEMLNVVLLSLNIFFCFIYCYARLCCWFIANVFLAFSEIFHQKIICFGQLSQDILKSKICIKNLNLLFLVQFDFLLTTAFKNCANNHSLYLFWWCSLIYRSNLISFLTRETWEMGTNLLIYAYMNKTKIKTISWFIFFNTICIDHW